MNFQIGDLIIAKDNRNRRRVGYITAIHESDPDWSHKSITIQYSADHWIILAIKTIESRLNQPFKPARWYHYPVKS